MNIPISDLPRVVIIGGGFGGVSLVRELEKKPFQIVMIDKRNYHTFQPLLYQVSTSGLEPDSIAYPLRKILKKNKDAYFRMAEVNHINNEKRLVETNIGNITYDYLVIATGSKTNFFGNKSVEQNAIWMKTVPQSLNLRSLILENFEEAAITTDAKRRSALLNFVIAGAGPTGVELSGALAELRKNVIPKDFQDIDPEEIHIHLIEGLDKVLPPMSDTSSANAKKYLEELDVEIHLNTFVQSYDNQVVKTSQDGLSFHTETFIWSAGVTGAAIEGLKDDAMHTKANRYRVNTFNQVHGYDTIFAIGDIAFMPSKNYLEGHPMVAQPAIQQGKHLAKNLLRILNKQPLLPFNYYDKGTMATVGRNKAVVDLEKIKFGGAFAWFVWMFIHLWFLVGFRNRIVTFFNWTYSYINYDRAARLIVRPFKAEKLKSPD